MNLKDIIHETAEAVGAIEYLAGVPVIEEEKGDLTCENHLAIAKQKCCIQVGWSGASPIKQSEELIVADVDIVVSVFEKPIRNRTTANAPTICNMAQAIAKALTYARADGMDAPLFLKSISPISEAPELGGGTVVCFVTFNTKAEL